jgi:HlyD family secretion protein
MEELRLMLDDQLGLKGLCGEDTVVPFLQNNMMKTEKILPSPFAEVSVEHILHHYNRKPKVIYLCVLVLVVGSFGSLFFIKVDISVQAQGIIKTPSERVYPKASGSGYIQYVHPKLQENVRVMAGDTLIVIGRDVWDEQLRSITFRKVELNRLLSDLNLLTNLPYKEIGEVYERTYTFQTALYRQNYQLFYHRFQNTMEHYFAVQKSYGRNKLLFERQVIALADFEQIAQEYDNAVSGFSTLYNEQMNQWRQEQQKYRDEINDLTSRLIQLTLQKQELTITAPVTGSVQQLQGLKIGNYISEGEVLMEISPEGTLYAECWIGPHNIGFIHNGQQAVIQIDALNYNEWGMLQASVTDMASDVVFLDGRPFFKVYCKPQKEYLLLKNGYTGKIIKGMTLNVRFMVTRRTLFQWIYDKMDNWLNPNIVTGA